MATSSVQSGAEVPGSVSLWSFVQPFTKNWNTPIPEAPKEGHSWSVVTAEDKKYLNHEGKELYTYDTNDWALAKSIGVIFTGHLYFGASLARHVGSGLLETGKRLQHIYRDYQVLKGEEQFVFKTFALNQLSSFSAAGKEFKQAGKDLVCFVPFFYSFLAIVPPLGLSTIAATILDYTYISSIAATILDYTYISTIGSYVGLGATALAVAHAAYAPLDARVYLNRLEHWHRQEGIKPLSDREVEKLSALEYLNEATKGSISLGQIFKMNRQFAVVKERAADTEKPKAE